MTARVGVAVKIVPKPEEVTLDEETMTLDREEADSQINPADKNAVELALQWKDAAEDDLEVVALSMGPPFFEEQLQDVIAMGVDEAYLLSDRAFGGADTYPTSRVLASGVGAVGDIDVLLCGEESSDSSTGQVPPGIAEWLDRPQVTYVEDATYEGDAVTATRTSTAGEETVRVPTPAVISVAYGINEPRFPDFKRKKWADTEWGPVIWDAEALDLPADEVGQAGSRTDVVSLESIDAPDRRREFLGGDPADQAVAIAEVLSEELP